MELFLGIRLEDDLEGLGLLEQSIDNVDEFFDLLSVFRCEGLLLHEVEELDLSQLGQDINHALRDLLISF